MSKNPLLWATDVHLDHVRTPRAAEAFGQSARSRYPQSRGLLVTGDIGEGDSVTSILSDLQAGYEGPLYFVLGNHDYYRRDFLTVDAEVAALSSTHPHIHWLTQTPIELSEGVCLVGNEGFYDARYGNEFTHLRLRDFTAIYDLFEAQDDSYLSLLDAIRARADASAGALEQQMRKVLSADHVSSLVVATHVPPFQEAAFYQGQPADPVWAPFFSSRATGDVLMRASEEHPEVRFVVLCGHTHGEGEVEMTPNLKVVTGGANYGAPELCGLVDVRTTNVDVKRLSIPGAGERPVS